MMPTTELTSHARASVLVLLEAYSMTSTAKVVMTFASMLRADPQHDLSRRIVVVLFNRRHAVIDRQLGPAFEELGAQVEYIEERCRFDFSTIFQLRRLLQKHRPSVIWSNSVKSHFIVRVIGAHHLLPWVAFHHGYTTTDLRMRAYNLLDRWSLRAAHRVTTVCMPFSGVLARRGVEIGRISVVPVPALGARPVSGSELRQLREKYCIPESSKVLVTVGRLSKEKGHADLIRAFAQSSACAQGALLLILGAGPEEAHLKSLSRACKVEKAVLLLGHQSDVAPFLRIADTFVLPSHSEGCPLALLEAISAEVPIVATAVGGVPEIVQAGTQAVLIPPGDLPALTGAIDEVLSCEQRRVMLVHAARGSLKRYSSTSFYGSMQRVIALAISEIASRRSRNDSVPAM